MGSTVLAIILGGGKGSRMGPLCHHRAKPLLPFLGQCRVIDFTLWNVRRSNVWNVAVLTDYRKESVREYVQSSSHDGVKVLDPPLGTYRGTADAVYQNLGYVLGQGADVVLVLASDHVYKMDYRPFLAFHQARGAGVTVSLVPVAPREAHHLGIATTDEASRITQFQEKPASPSGTLASMGIYAFDRDYLVHLLRQDAERLESAHDFGYSILPEAVRDREAFGYTFDGYWRDIGTVESYYHSNMEWLMGHSASMPVALAGTFADYPVRPVNTGHYIAPSATVHGVVQRSVIGPEVVVERGAVVLDSVLLDTCYIGKNALVERAVLDERVWVCDGSRVGCQLPSAVDLGDIVTIGRASVVPPASLLAAAV